MRKYRVLRSSCRIRKLRSVSLCSLWLCQVSSQLVGMPSLVATSAYPTPKKSKTNSWISSRHSWRITLQRMMKVKAREHSQPLQAANQTKKRNRRLELRKSQLVPPPREISLQRDLLRRPIEPIVSRRRKSCSLPSSRMWIRSRLTLVSFSRTPGPSASTRSRLR